MAKRIRWNKFKAGKTYWTVTATFRRGETPNIYLMTWTTSGEWTSDIRFGDVRREPKVYRTRTEAESAALLLATRFPEKIGSIEVAECQHSQDFSQVAG